MYLSENETESGNDSEGYGVVLDFASSLKQFIKRDTCEKTRRVTKTYMEDSALVLDFGVVPDIVNPFDTQLPNDELEDSVERYFASDTDSMASQSFLSDSNDDGEIDADRGRKKRRNKGHKKRKKKYPSKVAEWHRDTKQKYVPPGYRKGDTPPRNTKKLRPRASQPRASQPSVIIDLSDTN